MSLGHCLNIYLSELMSDCFRFQAPEANFWQKSREYWFSTMWYIEYVIIDQFFNIFNHKAIVMNCVCDKLKKIFNKVSLRCSPGATIYQNSKILWKILHFHQTALTIFYQTCNKYFFDRFPILIATNFMKKGWFLIDLWMF